MKLFLCVSPIRRRKTALFVFLSSVQRFTNGSLQIPIACILNQWLGKIQPVSFSVLERFVAVFGGLVGIPLPLPPFSLPSRTFQSFPSPRWLVLSALFPSVIFYLFASNLNPIKQHWSSEEKKASSSSIREISPDDGGVINPGLIAMLTELEMLEQQPTPVASPNDDRQSTGLCDASLIFVFKFQFSILSIHLLVASNKCISASDLNCCPCSQPWIRLKKSEIFETSKGNIDPTKRP